MSIKEKLLKKKKELKDQYNRGKDVTMQMKAERIRKRNRRIADMKPGARRAITEGLVMKKSIGDVFSEELERRRINREKKYGKK